MAKYALSKWFGRGAGHEDWMDFIFDGRREGFITNAVSKEAVTEYVEQFHSVPPGIEVTPQTAGCRR